MDSSGALMTFLIQTLLNFKAAELFPLTVFPLQILSFSKHICLHRSASPLCVFLEGPRAKGQCLGCQRPLLWRGVQISVHHRCMNHFPLRNSAEQNVSFPLFTNFFTILRPTKSFVLKQNGENAFILFQLTFIFYF